MHPSFPMSALVFACLLMVGCAQPAPSDLESPGEAVEHRVRLVELQATEGGGITASGDEAEAAKWDDTLIREAAPPDANPSDYGANSEGAYWQDDLIQAKSYELAAGAVITTHTHGIVILAADSIMIRGTVDVRGLGAAPGELGYASTRAATLALYSGYGETDPETGEPRLWGAAGETCPGGGYVILSARQITLEGTLDAGSDCGQGGIVILEGTVTGTGQILASQVIHRGGNA